MWSTRWPTGSYKNPKSCSMVEITPSVCNTYLTNFIANRATTTWILSVMQFPINNKVNPTECSSQDRFICSVCLFLFYSGHSDKWSFKIFISGLHRLINVNVSYPCSGSLICCNLDRWQKQTWKIIIRTYFNTASLTLKFCVAQGFFPWSLSGHQLPLAFMYK